MFTYTKLHKPAIECKEGRCTSRLVEFELLLELQIKQKKGTSLVKLVLSCRKSGLLHSVCPSQLYRVNSAHGSTQNPPISVVLVNSFQAIRISIDIFF
jgi:hypothetical protein